MSVPSVLLRRATRRGAVLAAAALLALTGCSSDGDDAPPAGDGEPTTIQLTITDEEISPMGERINVEAGEPITVEITADREGSLHVHSTPEHNLDFVDGTVSHEITIDQPGIFEVELHDPDTLLVQLQVN